MCSEEKSLTATDEQDAMTDPLNPWLAAAFPELALPLLPDESGCNDATGELTDADRQAFASLGTPKELVRRVIAASEARAPSRAMLPTHISQRSATAPDPGVAFGKAVTRDDALIHNFETFDREEHLRWESRYRKLEKIGAGGQGTVYLVQSLEEFSVPSALKVFSPAPYFDARAYDEEMRRIAHVASLVHRMHPDNLLNVERFVNLNRIHAMVTQWIDGYDLRRLLYSMQLDKLCAHVGPVRWADLTNVVFSQVGPRQLRLKPGLAVYIIEKCLQGADALHGNGIVHGDIKPSNIMLDCYGSVKIIDIGSAFELDAPPRQHTLTPLYAAPEYLAHGKWTTQSDLASLGYVLIELLSGRPAIADVDADLDSTMTSDKQRDEALLEAKLSLPGRLPALLPPDAQECDHLMNLCLRLIEPNPKKRFRSAADAIVSREGTFDFNKQLAAGNLTVHFNRVIKGWLEDVRKVEH